MILYRCGFLLTGIPVQPYDPILVLSDPAAEAAELSAFRIRDKNSLTPYNSYILIPASLTYDPGAGGQASPIHLAASGAADTITFRLYVCLLFQLHRSSHDTTADSLL